LGIFTKITEVAQNFGLFFPMYLHTYYVSILKKWLGYVLGIFFANSSGHPGCRAAQADFFDRLIEKISDELEPGLPDGLFSNQKYQIWVILKKFEW
jgi:hypothetical protein